MYRARHIWILVAAIMFLSSTALAVESRDRKKKKKKAEEKKIHWVFINYKQFQIEHLIGNLTSCIYRASKPGETVVLEDGDKIQVTAVRKGEAVEIQVRVNEARLSEFNAEMMEKGVEEAITLCFTRLTDDDDDLLFHSDD
jgi:hypothetical protein